MSKLHILDKIHGDRDFEWKPGDDEAFATAAAAVTTAKREMAGALIRTSPGPEEVVGSLDQTLEQAEYTLIPQIQGG